MTLLGVSCSFYFAQPAGAILASQAGTHKKCLTPTQFTIYFTQKQTVNYPVNNVKFNVGTNPVVNFFQ